MRIAALRMHFDLGNSRITAAQMAFSTSVDLIDSNRAFQIPGKVGADEVVGVLTGITIAPIFGVGAGGTRVSSKFGAKFGSRISHDVASGEA